MADTSYYALRCKIVFFVVLLAGLLGVPTWYATTSVYRADLPEEQIDALNGNIVSRIHYTVPIYVLDVPEPLEGLLVEAQRLIDGKVASYKSPVKAEFKLISAEAKDVEENACTLKLITLEPEDDRTESLYISPLSDRLVKIFLSPAVVTNGAVADFIMRVVTQDLFGSELEMLQRLGQDHQGDYNLVRMPYSPNYKVSLSFLEESDDPIHWQVEQIMDRFSRYIELLSEYANFTVETQVSYYESLPPTISVKSEGANTLLLEDTSTFMDYSEWGLDQDVEMVPSINLVVYVPDSEHEIVIPGSDTNSFVVPQWGGVVIRNNRQDTREVTEMGTTELLPIFDILTSQLFQLLGAPNSPKSPYIRADILTRWQGVENLLKSVDNLVSLKKLTKQLPMIPIPEITLQDVDETIELVDESVALLDSDQTGRWWGRVNALSCKALELSDKAFFQKDMVQQTYFPDEHKMAVYMPLLGPFATIVFLAVTRLLRERKVKEPQEAGDEKEEQVAESST